MITETLFISPDFTVKDIHKIRGGIINGQKYDVSGNSCILQ